MNNGYRFLKIGAVFVGILVVGLVVFALLIQKGNQRQTLKSLAVPKTYSSAIAFDTNTILFSNGKTFSTYNYATNNTKVVGPTNAGLNNIDTVSSSPNNNYVLFHDSSPSPKGILATQLDREGLDSPFGFWWIYSIQNKTFRHLPQGVLLAKLDDSHIYAISTKTGAEYMTTYTISNLKPTAAISISGSSNFFPVKNGFLLQTPGDKILATANGIVNNELLTSATLVGVTSDKQTAIAVITKNNSRSLVSINLQKNTTTTIATDIINAPVWLNSGTVLYVNNKSQLTSYNLTTHRNTALTLPSNVGDSAANLKLVSLVGQSTTIVKNQSGDYYLLGNNLKHTGK